MTDIPADAPRSDDGQWWWDGSQWQPVQPAGGADPGTAQAGTADPASAADPATSQTTGQLSEDGQWRWDGTQWQPAQAAGSGPASSGADPADGQQPAAQDQQVQWDMSGASTAALFALNEQPDPAQSDEQQA